ncbi:hypothetical protein GOP47_0031143 [Adiantum capillus-veneris]|nr:hypothetical protein GOP47_0031143 [Adiantum capillus-veneris]
MSCELGPGSHWSGHIGAVEITSPDARFQVEELQNALLVYIDNGVQETGLRVQTKSEEIYRPFFTMGKIRFVDNFGNSLKKRQGVYFLRVPCIKCHMHYVCSAQAQKVLHYIAVRITALTRRYTNAKTWTVYSSAGITHSLV